MAGEKVSFKKISDLYLSISTVSLYFNGISCLHTVFVNRPFCEKPLLIIEDAFPGAHTPAVALVRLRAR